VANTIDDYFNANVAPDISQGVTLLEENRAYIVTYVTDRGEESAPSPASELIECDQNDTVDITVPARAERAATSRTSARTGRSRRTARRRSTTCPILRTMRAGRSAR
jgi:hypothetical protein